MMITGPRLMHKVLYYITLIGLLTLVKTSAHAQVSGDGLFAENRFTEARAAYSQEIRANPKRVSSRLGLLRTLIRLDDWQTALAQGHIAELALPDNADIKGLLGLVLMRAGEPEDAKVEADAGVALDHESYWALLGEARVLSWNESKSAALQMLRHATELHPDWPEAWCYLIDALISDKNTDLIPAITAFRKLMPQGHPLDQQLEGIDGKLKYIQSLAKDQTPPVDGAHVSNAIKDADDGTGPPISVRLSIERDEHGFVLMPVDIDGKTYKLMLDTGAGDNVTLGNDAASVLGLSEVATSVTRGANGKESTVLYNAPSMRIGALTMKSVPFDNVVDQVGPRDGVIGGAFFHNYAVTIDFDDDTLTLARGKSVTAPKTQLGYHAVSVPFKLFGGYIFVRTNIGERTRWCLLDSGASGICLVSLNLARQIATERGTETFTEGVIDGRIGIGQSNTKIQTLEFKYSLPIGLMEGDRTPFHVEAEPTEAISVLDTEISSMFDFQLGAVIGIKYLDSANRITIDYPHSILTMEFSDGPPPP